MGSRPSFSEVLVCRGCAGCDVLVGACVLLGAGTSAFVYTDFLCFVYGFVSGGSLSLLEGGLCYFWC